MHNPDLQYIHTNWKNLNELRIPGTHRPTKQLEPWLQLQPTTGTNAPTHLDVLDVVLDITTDIYLWIEEAGFQPNTTNTTTALIELDRILKGAQTVSSLASWAQRVETWGANYAAQVRYHVEGGLDGHIIKARCPICKAQDSLRIRTLDGQHKEPYLRCESGYCAPPDAYCKTMVAGFPAWPMSDWEWFSDLLRVENRGV